MKNMWVISFPWSIHPTPNLPPKALGGREGRRGAQPHRQLTNGNSGPDPEIRPRNPNPANRGQTGMGIMALPPPRTLYVCLHARSESAPLDTDWSRGRGGGRPCTYDGGGKGHSHLLPLLSRPLGRRATTTSVRPPPQPPNHTKPSSTKRNREPIYSSDDPRKIPPPPPHSSEDPSVTPIRPLPLRHSNFPPPPPPINVGLSPLPSSKFVVVIHPSPSSVSPLFHPKIGQSNSRIFWEFQKDGGRQTEGK